MLATSTMSNCKSLHLAAVGPRNIQQQDAGDGGESAVAPEKVLEQVNLRAALFAAHGTAYREWKLMTAQGATGLVRLLSTQPENPVAEHYFFVRTAPDLVLSSGKVLYVALQKCLQEANAAAGKIYPSQQIGDWLQRAGATEINRYWRFQLPDLHDFVERPILQQPDPTLDFSFTDVLSAEDAAHWSPLMSRCYQDQPFHADFHNKKTVVAADLLAEVKQYALTGGKVRYAFVSGPNREAVAIALARVGGGNSSSEIDLGSIAVAPHWRGRGIARWMVTRLLSSLAQSEDLNRSVYSEVSVHHRVMPRIFGELGFEVQSERPEFLIAVG